MHGSSIESQLASSWNHENEPGRGKYVAGIQIGTLCSRPTRHVSDESNGIWGSYPTQYPSLTEASVWITPSHHNHGPRLTWGKAL